MALVKLKQAYPNYKGEIFEGRDLTNYDVYDKTNYKVGSVEEILLDETGRFRYFVVDTGFWVFGKKILVPMGRIEIDDEQERIYLVDLKKEEAEKLPKYDESTTVDYDYEEQVRNVYRPQPVNTPTYTKETYSYEEHDAPLYNIRERDQTNVKRYEDRIGAMR